MPGSPQPVGQNGSLGPWWNAVISALTSLQQQVASLKGGATQGPNIVDMFGNTVEVSGTNVDQTVTIGASHGQAGVQVMTAIGTPAAPIAGRAIAQNAAADVTKPPWVTTTITLTKGSTTGTVASATGLANGMVIGAANVSDPSTGIATPAIVPGTTFTISGTTVTLSQAAAESGSGLFCAACFWRLVAGISYP